MREIVNDYYDIFFTPEANFLSIDLINQFVEMWHKLLNDLKQQLTNAKKEKKTSPDQLKQLIEDWFSKVSKSYEDSTDFAKYAFQAK